MSEEIKQDEIELAKMLSKEIGEEVEIVYTDTSKPNSTINVDSEMTDLISHYVDEINPKHLEGLKMWECCGVGSSEDEALKWADDLLGPMQYNDPKFIVEFIKINDDAKLPYQATSDAACSDIYSVEDVVIPPGKTKLISTGLKVAHIPTGYKLEVYDRSGMGAKGILLGNGVGQVDSDYRGELKVILFNSNDSDFVVKIGDRIAQVALEKVINVSYKFVDSFEKTDRGEGGFGSTGI